MESFFDTLKAEYFHLDQFDTVEQLQRGIADYIQYYNHQRIKQKLNGLSPVLTGLRPWPSAKRTNRPTIGAQFTWAGLLLRVLFHSGFDYQSRPCGKYLLLECATDEPCASLISICVE
ncbi:hypothetical protein GCM10007159_42020 [Modicisalibacter luteus]|nr:hypothetical protein GCM10007159_42020 [Halomonas lutea]